MVQKGQWLVRGASALVVRVARGSRPWTLVVQQDACRTGEYSFRGVLDEEVLELRGQVPGASPLVPFNCIDDGPGEEVCGLLTPSCRGMADRGAHGAGERDIEKDMA
ncbi:hypothetical protein ACFOZ0_13340 [Streptomyces yaanensis]|uniref:Uncharacterized protein n=1 Tax=Streptomyces yaanensis TaxID=1142239 RepID=A0ABV7SBA7_9ACTN|nr:hypothetical protein [Streptomyces sp. CGMCC 4.7035]WNB98913.1 hypothetical protein Q2K21_12960 [Streptomyces sp. CGMCC 4.7035]